MKRALQMTPVWIGFLLIVSTTCSSAEDGFQFPVESNLRAAVVKVDITPPAPSGPRLDRDWGAQFGMEPEAPVAEAPAAETAASTDELPMIDVESEVATPKVWVAPIINSWDAASGMTQPPCSTVIP